MEILLALHDSEYVQTETLRHLVGSDSTDSVSKTIEKINNVAKTKLQLPKSKRLIENDPGSGYYIDQTYNVVVTKESSPRSECTSHQNALCLQGFLAIAFLNGRMRNALITPILYW